MTNPSTIKINLLFPSIVLTICFCIGKLAGFIAWSWFWVLFPVIFYLSFVGCIIGFICLFICFCFIVAISTGKTKNKRK